MELPQHVEGDDDDDGDGDGDDDMELLSAIADDECDGFTTLSQIVSAAGATATPAAAATAITVTTTTTTSAIDKLIDAETGCIENVASSSPKPQAVQHQSSLQNLLASDDSRSQHLSDIDNESFNSIDFDAEITIAGVRDPQTTTTATSTAPTPTTTTVESTDSMPDGTTIGTFFNNLLSHSNAGELFVPMHNFITGSTL